MEVDVAMEKDLNPKSGQSNECGIQSLNNEIGRLGITMVNSGQVLLGFAGNEGLKASTATSDAGEAKNIAAKGQPFYVWIGGNLASHLSPQLKMFALFF